jgi:hypothetical protein
MNTDMKWAALAFMFVIGIPMVGLAFSEYQKGQCRVEAIKASREPEKISQVCK